MGEVHVACASKNTRTSIFAQLDQRTVGAQHKLKICVSSFERGILHFELESDRSAVVVDEDPPDSKVIGAKWRQQRTPRHPIVRHPIASIVPGSEEKH